MGLPHRTWKIWDLSCGHGWMHGCASGNLREKQQVAWSTASKWNDIFPISVCSKEAIRGGEGTRQIIKIWDIRIYWNAISDLWSGTTWYMYGLWAITSLGVIWDGTYRVLNTLPQWISFSQVIRLTWLINFQYIHSTPSACLGANLLSK